MKKIKSYKYTIKSNCILSENSESEYNSIENIEDIKISLSKNGLQILICYRYMEVNTHCLYYNIESISFQDINYNIDNCLKLETYYFKETNKYIIICIINKSRNNIDFKLIALNDDFSKGNIEGKDEILINLTECENINDFSLVYSNINQDYILITDCYNSYIGWYIYYNNIIHFNNNSLINSGNYTYNITDNYSNSVSNSIFIFDNISTSYSSSDSSQIFNTNMNSNSLSNNIETNLNTDSLTILHYSTTPSFNPTNSISTYIDFDKINTINNINFPPDYYDFENKVIKMEQIKKKKN